MTNFLPASYPLCLRSSNLPNSHVSSPPIPRSSIPNDLSASPSSKIRVVHVLHSFGIGGMEKGIAMLINHGSPGIEHVIVCLTYAGDSRKLLRKNTSIYEMKKPPGNSVVFLFRLTKLLRSLKPCIVHCRNWGGLDGVIAARMAGIRQVIQGEHGWDIGDQDGLNQKRIFMRRFLSRFVNQYSCVSAHMFAWLKNSIGVQRPIHHIYNGIDTNLFSPEDGDTRLREQLGITESNFVIGTVGRLDPIKNHTMLISSFKKINLRFPETRLVIVGDGPEMKHIESLANESIILLGQRDDIPKLMRLFHVYAMTSYNEGISNTILEAMACGKPVVATRVGGNPELVVHGKNGCLIESEDEIALADCLIGYLEDDELRLKHGSEARKYVIERFSIDSMVGNYEKMYQSIAFELSL